MQEGTSDLGCSVRVLCALSVPSWSTGNWGDKTYDNVYTAAAIAAMKKKWRDDGKGGICLFTDTSEHDDNRSSGKKFYEFLVSRGEYVSKTEPYKNLGHEGMCTTYFWYYRKKPRSTKADGGKTVVKKAGTVAQRVDGRVRRVGQVR